MSNMAGRFMASHNYDGFWTVFDTETSELILNITAVGFSGDLGQVAHLPTYTTTDVQDLVKVLGYAVTGVRLGGWEDYGHGRYSPADPTPGRPIEQVIAEAEDILREHRPGSLGS
jgi:hypothetical protein